jgi:hypothetical protein
MYTTHTIPTTALRRSKGVGHQFMAVNVNAMPIWRRWTVRSEIVKRQYSPQKPVVGRGRDMGRELTAIVRGNPLRDRRPEQSLMIPLTGVYFKGNVPSVGLHVFAGNYKVIVYYLPGTTGWGPTFGGRPTV